MIKLIVLSVLGLFSTNAIAVQEIAVNEMDMAGAMIISVPLIILLSVVFLHYKNKKKLVIKKSYASTNVVIHKNSNTSKDDKRKSNPWDISPDLDIAPNTTKVVTAVAIDDLISDGGEMSGGGSSLDFDFDWD